jgi:hypothetical protein
MVPLSHEELAPGDAPTTDITTADGVTAWAHNMRLLVELVKKERGDDHITPLEKLTANRVVDLIAAQKQRRCRQIHDERVGTASLPSLLHL